MKLLSFGEILWDIVDSNEYLGGAPFNLAAHAARCGADCAFVSSVGDDLRGREALGRAKEMNIDCTGVQVNKNHPTGTVDAILSEDGQPDYDIHEPVAYDFIELDEEAIKKIVESRFDVFCFGSLAQRSKTTHNSLLRLLAAFSDSDTQIFCDVNLRQNYYSKEILEASLAACDILKLNDDEVGVIAKMFYGSGKMEIEDFCGRLSGEMDIKDIIVTMGEKGVLVFDGSNCHIIEGANVEVIDTIGAGDAFSAVYLCKRLNGGDSRQAAAQANRVAAFVCTQNGAVPALPENDLKGELYA